MRVLTSTLMWLILALPNAGLLVRSQDPPAEWIDPATGHRVIRLSREPGSASLYFHQNAYSPDGQKLIITTPTGLSTINLKTRAVEQIIEGRVNVIVTGRKSGQVYYTKREGAETVIYATHLNTKVTKQVAKLQRGSVASVNADETLLLGSFSEGEQRGLSGGQGGQRSQQEQINGPDGKPLTFAEQKEVRLNNRLEQQIPMAMFTVSTETGEMKVIHRATDWLNHMQFSPTNPGLIMFCHEGPWHKVDRIWNIHTDGTGLTKVHTRTMDMEIAGHEFFSADGRTIWYDLQMPRSQVFWLAGYEIGSGSRTWYRLERSEWSVHFNVSPDGRLFAGDGGGPRSVAAPGNGQWIYLFRPEQLPMTGLPGKTDGPIRPGVLKAERLVDLSKHDYTLEPNVTFTPDGKWIVFRSNMHGATHVYAVEVAKKN